MLQLDAKMQVILCTGVSGSGKSTFAIRYLLGAKKVACRFVFDYQGEFWQRLKVPPVETMEEFGLAMADGFCVFDPGAMFPGEWEKAFDWFCKFVYEACLTIPGRKLFLIDEVWKYSNPNKIPKPLAICCQEGRKRGLGLLFTAQRPNQLNESITNETTEMVCFRLQGENALDTVEKLGANRQLVSNLPLGSFVSRITENGREIRGKLW